MKLVFDVMSAAPLYSTLAGVLAGFAFAAIVWVIDKPGTGRRAEITSVVVAALLTVFLGMVLASFIYSEVCGEKIVERTPTNGNDGSNEGEWRTVAVHELDRDASDEARRDEARLLVSRIQAMTGMAGFIFAASGVLMFWSITLLMHSHGITSGLRAVRSVFIVALEFVLFIYAATVFDPSNAEGVFANGGLVWWFLALGGALQTAGWAASRRRSDDFVELAKCVPGTNLALICAAVVWFALAAMDMQCSQHWLYWRGGLAGGLCLLLVLSGLYVHLACRMVQTPAEG